MSSRPWRALTGGAAALGIGLFAAVPSALTASAATAAALPQIKPGHVLYDVGIHSDVTRAEAVKAAIAGSSFTQYKASVTVGTRKYTYVIAGKNPAVKVANPVSTIKVLLVPLDVKFLDNTWDPAKTDSCDSGASALTRTQNSPIFKSQSWTWGGTAIGTGQVTDAFQRAEFWKYTQPGGINPGYGVDLAVTTHRAVTVTVPLADGATAPIKCGNGLEGAANINWLDPQIKSKVIPSLKVSPSTVPIFLLHNVVLFVGDTNTCCVIGYHNAYNVTGGIQTYALGDYEDSGLLPSSTVSDISALTHEVGEWQTDPYTINPTPAWGNVGQVSGCQGNLEVGDPLTGTTFADTVGGFTYHAQELAFFSWFYHQKPSLGVNGWYSDQGTFKSPAAKCPPGGA